MKGKSVFVKFFLALVVVFSFILFGCDSSGDSGGSGSTGGGNNPSGYDSGGTNSGKVAVVGVSLKTSTSILIGATEALTAVISPSNATNQNVTWRSSNTDVATVSTSGTVSAVDAGTATITVTTEDGGRTANCSVTVSSSSVAVTGISLKSSTSLTVGGKEFLSATISPSSATNQNVTWSSSNTSVATVSPGGLVTAVAAGSATITVTTVDGGKTAACAVAVSAAPGGSGPGGTEPGGTSSGSSDTFNVYNNEDWSRALYAIHTGGNDKSYTITLHNDISVYINGPSYSFNIEELTLTIRGSGTILLTSGSFYVSPSQSLTIQDINLEMSPYTSHIASCVYVEGSFTMQGNASLSNPSGTGVYVKGGTFTMDGGTISGCNTVGAGGGVLVDGTFIMNGGAISNNTGGSGGVAASTFIMNGGTISNNTARIQGGGVYASTFTMTGGTISNNTAAGGGWGGGVLCGTFTMTGGTITGNAAGIGGGVFLSGSESVFIKNGGTITGYASDPINGNVAKDSSGTIQSDRGHAVYVNAYPLRKRKEITAGPGDNLYWNGEDGSFSGAWD